MDFFIVALSFLRKKSKKNRYLSISYTINIHFNAHEFEMLV